MAELNSAKLVERTSRLWLKKSKEHLVEVLGEDPKVLERVSTAFSQLEKTLKSWEEAELEVERLVKEEDLESQIDNAFSFKKGILDVIAQAETYYSSLNPSTPNKSPSVSSLNSSASSTTLKTDVTISMDHPRFYTDGPSEKFCGW